MVKHIIALILFFPCFSFAAESSSLTCKTAGPRIRKLAVEVESDSANNDVSGTITAIEEIANRCDIDVAKFGLIPSLIKKWKLTGFNAVFNRTKRNIEHYSKYRDISAEAQTLKVYANELSLDPAMTDGYIKKYTQIGFASQDREQTLCAPDRNLRNKALGKPWDQGTTKWCYASAAADLLTYKLGKRISPMDVAISYENEFWGQYLKMMSGGSGFSKDAIQAVAKRGGACLEADLRSEDPAVMDWGARIAKLADAKQKKISPFEAVSPLVICEGIVPGFVPVFRQFMDAYHNTMSTEKLNILSQRSCTSRISIEKLKVQTSAPGASPGELTKMLDEQLTKKNIASIGYNSAILLNKDNESSEMPHESTVVGRRFNLKKRECEYLIRNSLGTEAQGYDPSYEEDQGNLWVPKSVIEKVIEDVTYVE